MSISTSVDAPVHRTRPHSAIRSDTIRVADRAVRANVRVGVPIRIHIGVGPRLVALSTGCAVLGLAFVPSGRCGDGDAPLLHVDKART